MGTGPSAAARLAGGGISFAIIGVAAALLLATVAPRPVTPHGQSAPPSTSTIDPESAYDTSEAVAIAATGSNESLLVRGYLALVVPSCPDAYPRHPLIQPCLGLGLWPHPLPDPFLSQSGIAVLPADAISELRDIPISQDSATPVVLRGHFNDERAETCPAEWVDRCAGAFVVEGVAWRGDPPASVAGDPTLPKQSLAFGGDLAIVLPAGWHAVPAAPTAWKIAPLDAPEWAITLRARDAIRVDAEDGVATYYPDAHSIAYDHDGPVSTWVVESGTGSSRRSVFGVAAADATYELVLDWSAPDDRLPILLNGFNEIRQSLEMKPNGVSE